MKYYHVDVFSRKPYSGNGLTVFVGDNFEKSYMQTVTQEMRQFESIFLTQINSNTFRAYIFTMEEELDFAGHPIIGAAAILHEIYSNEMQENTWNLEMNAKNVIVKTKKENDYYSAQMNQGRPEFLNTLHQEQELLFLRALNLSVEDKFEGLPFQVITTGLPYLILPLKAESLSKVKVLTGDLERKLEEVGAKFFFVLDIQNLTGRTWDNLGLVEDIATGSSAGPVGAYLVKNKIVPPDQEFVLKQGAYLGRPSEIKVIVTSKNREIDNIFVEGDVCQIAIGDLLR
ncbi:PhzF family phenazine biosynthesis protein [Pedobacter sp. PAMC26386]|nr:PhzF family phenazine biosynthesis protein [Pedobacter sp. PAMC26386]